MSDAVQLWAALAGAAVSAALSGYFAYRMGRSAAQDERDVQIDKRLREVELGMVELQVLIRKRRERRQREADRRRFHLESGAEIRNPEHPPN